LSALPEGEPCDAALSAYHRISQKARGKSLLIAVSYDKMEKTKLREAMYAQRKQDHQ
jgi:ribosomal protein S21